MVQVSFISCKMSWLSSESSRCSPLICSLWCPDDLLQQTGLSGFFWVMNATQDRRMLLFHFRGCYGDCVWNDISICPRWEQFKIDTSSLLAGNVYLLISASDGHISVRVRIIWCGNICQHIVCPADSVDRPNKRDLPANCQTEGVTGGGITWNGSHRMSILR